MKKVIILVALATGCGGASSNARVQAFTAAAAVCTAVKQDAVESGDRESFEQTKKICRLILDRIEHAQ